MILQLRIESKLYNGIVTEQNARAVSAKMILLAQDETAQNEFMKKSILAQANPDFKVQIRGIEESVKLLSDPRAKKLKVQIICTKPSDGERFLEALGPVEVIVGKYKVKKAEKKLELSPNWVIDQAELSCWKHLYELSEGKMYGQLLSEYPKIDFMELLEKAGVC